jgi:glycosyltransferase involved in cell wall biosynthesis
MLSVSIVVPVYNEVENIPRLYQALLDVLPLLGREYEIIFVDDGSQDGSLAALRDLAQTDENVKILEFRHNFGQTAAMAAGIQAATCDVVVTLDADLQNDPADIPRMLAKIDEGFDVVHGWRKNRQDALVSRKLPSRVANWLIARVTRFSVHDLGCTLKAMRREVAQELELYGEMHRFIPILAHCRGARCAEIETNHHPRRFGKSKYGISRTVRVLLDLITVKYLVQYLVSPMKLFGVLGLISLAVGAMSGTATVAMKLVQQIDMTGNPLLLLTVLSIMLGAQFLVLGMLGELGARIYFVARRMPPYAIRERINFDVERPVLPMSRPLMKTARRAG